MVAPNWPGLYKFAARYSDGTNSSAFERMSEQDKQWLSEALQEGVVDNTERMKAINAVLHIETSDTEAVACKAELLEELLDIVENIDFARDLHKVGGVQTLISLLGSQHASLRWRAAEVVGMAVQGSEPVQRWFLDRGVMPPILNLLDDNDGVCRTKALLALSCLVRHSSPGLAAFCSAGGLQRLLSVVASYAPSACGRAEQEVSVSSLSGACQQLSNADQGEGSPAASDCPHEQVNRCPNQARSDPRQLRKALQLLTYIAQEEDPHPVCQLIKSQNLLPSLQNCVKDNDDDVRQAALAFLVALSKSSSGLQQLHKGRNLKELLQQRLRQLSAMDVEDLSAVREELGLVEVLIKALGDAAAANCKAQPQAGSNVAQPKASWELSAV